jgi:hypothetical protein
MNGESGKLRTHETFFSFLFFKWIVQELLITFLIFNEFSKNY